MSDTLRASRDHYTRDTLCIRNEMEYMHIAAAAQSLIINSEIIITKDTLFRLPNESHEPEKCRINSELDRMPGPFIPLIKSALSLMIVAYRDE